MPENCWNEYLFKLQDYQRETCSFQVVSLSDQIGAEKLQNPLFKIIQFVNIQEDILKQVVLRRDLYFLNLFCSYIRVIYVYVSSLLLSSENIC